MTEYSDVPFDDVCGVTYDKTIHQCAVDGGYASVWAVAALASVIKRPIISVYPKGVNGDNDDVAKTLHRIFKPRLNYDDTLDCICIMWTRNATSDRGKLWVTNHFVPLIRHPSPSIQQVRVKVVTVS